jgi:diphosphomevalonate decarboxylase
LSILARRGSGSASRSIPNGFVEWVCGDTSDSSYSHTLFHEDYWDILDIVVVVSKEKKEIATSEGQMRADSSIFFQTRLNHIEGKLTDCKRFIKEKDFTAFGKLIEMEALELHAIMLTSWPALIYWLPQSLYIMKSVEKWRKGGLEAYFTVNTGQDIHIICQKKDEIEVMDKIRNLEGVIKVIPNNPSKGTYLTEEHFF